MLFEILTLFALILLNGVLAMSETATVSARTTRLQAMAGQGHTGAATALRLAADPGTLLSTVQIGITLVGVLSGALSGATLGLRATDALLALGVSPAWAGTIGVGGVVGLVTYTSIVFGELVPKRLALRAPETLAAALAPLLAAVARITAPFVWLLNVSGKLVLFLLGQSRPVDRSMDDTEVDAMLAEARHAGVIDEDESALIAGVRQVADRTASSLMVPRRDVALLDHDATPAQAAALFRSSGHSRLVVVGARPDDVLGALHLRAFTPYAEADAFPGMASLLDAIPAVPEQMPAMDLLSVLRTAPAHMVAVYDEYGHFDGIVTPMDLLDGIAGGFADEPGDQGPVTERADGSFLVAAWMPAAAFVERFGLDADLADDHDTAAGVVLTAFGALPKVGAVTSLGGWAIEVVDMDGHRIDALLISHLPS